MLHRARLFARQNERQEDIVLQVERVKQVKILKDEPQILSAERRRVAVGETNWLPFAAPEQPLRVQAKLRYTPRTAEAWLYPTQAGCTLEFDVPQRAVTPGQAAAIYDGDTLLGGGIITGTLPEATEETV